MLVFIFLVAGFSRAQADPASPALPSWEGLSGEQRKVSGLLWKPDIDGAAGEISAPGETVEAVDPGRTEGGEAGRAGVASSADERLPEKPAYALEDYARGLSAARLLHDPRHLLSESATADLRSFLAFHARHSEVPIRVALFAPTDEPGKVLDLQALCEAWCAPRGSQGCMLVYCLGRPERSELYFPGWSAELRKVTESCRVVDLCVRAAQVAGNEISQLDRFGVELSLQIFRAGKILRARAVQQLSEALDRPGPGDAGSEVGWVSGLFVASLLALLVLGGIGILAVARKGSGVAEATSERGVFLFDDHEISPRLGGPHGGGAGGVLYFGEDRAG